MAVTLDYVKLSDFSDVMPENDQAEASDDTDYTDPNTDPTRDTDLIKRFLGRAESMANSYLIQYDLPLDDAPLALEYAIYVIARYMLLERGDGSVSESVQNSYDQAIAWLEAVRDGEQTLEPVEQEFLDNFVGHADYSKMEFEEYPFVDKSTFGTSSTPLN